MDTELESLRRTIMGNPPPGRRTVNGVLHLGRMYRLHRQTGLTPQQLLRVFDEIADTLPDSSSPEELVERYGESLIHLVAQYREVRDPADFQRRQRALLVLPPD